MKKPPQQPNMDEWLLDSLHGLHDGDDDEQEVLRPEHFLSSLTYKYVSTLQPKQHTLEIERQIRKIMSRSLWPRILISRCRLLLAHSLPLISDGHWIIMDFILNSLRLILHYIGMLINGLRLLMNLTLLVKPLFTDSLPLQGIKQALSHSWFELFLDAHSLISAVLPTTLLKTSCAFSALELGVFMLRGWLELRELSTFKQSFNGEITKNNLSEEHLIEMKKTEAHAAALYKLKLKKLVLNCAVLSVSILLFVFKYFMLPSLSLTLVSNPVVPLLFAVLALGLSLANHYGGQYLDKVKPKVKLSQLSGKVSFFKASAPVAEAPHAVELFSQLLEATSVTYSSNPCLS
ncbi:hypothetical protein [Legionella sp. km772]|uniref:hypothetical protein n=1 Tax=Legionella sp. km772 TaxID=2498111 RepID=UPI000F8E2F48|nr:hypothetical protein [Legionella sp. km772]RUR10810.1 hypothetical protein ELY15_07710 [Legionella sp. km772]